MLKNGTVLTIALLAALSSDYCCADPLKIRSAWVAPLANLASVWIEKKDLATHYGKSYTFEPVHFIGTPPMITAIANNELEIGDLAFSTFSIAVKNAGMDDIRVVADDVQDGIEGYYTIQFDVLADGPVRTIEDLRGKVVATNAAGSAVDVAMKAMLHRHGLEDKRDYTVVEAPFPAMRAKLAEKKVSLIASVIPFSLDPELRKIAHTLFTSAAAIGPSQTTMWTARKPFIEKNRSALVDFMEDTLRIVHWYLNPTNHGEVAQIAARITKQPADRFGWLYTKDDFYRSPDMVPNLDALQRNIDTTKQLGLIKESFNVKAYADLSIVGDAKRRLK